MDHSAHFVLRGTARGEVLACFEPISFWGGVDPATGRVIDVHHPLAGQTISGRILVIPGTRGSCTGSGVFAGHGVERHGPRRAGFL